MNNIEGDLKQGSQAASIVADTRRARHRVPVGADDDGPVGLGAPLGAGQDPDHVATGVRLLVVLQGKRYRFIIII